MDFANSEAAAWLILIGGIFAIAGAVFKWSFFFAHYRAKAIVNVLGEKWARIFYVVLGVILIVIGANLLIERHTCRMELKEFLNSAQSGSYFYIKTSHSKKAKVTPYQVVSVEPGAMVVKRGRIQSTRPMSDSEIQNLKRPDGSSIFHEEPLVIKNEEIDPMLFAAPIKE